MTTEAVWDTGQEESAEDDSAGNIEETPSLVKVLSIYQNTLGQITPLLQASIAEAYNQFPPAWIVEAIKAAKMAQVYRWAYVEGVLRRWSQNGYQAPLQAVPVARGVPAPIADDIRRRYG